MAQNPSTDIDTSLTIAVVDYKDYKNNTTVEDFAEAEEITKALLNINNPEEIPQ